MALGYHAGRGARAAGWLLIAAWAAVTLTSLFAPAVAPSEQARYITVALMIAFTLLHGSGRYGWAGVLVYIAIAVLISNVFENLSIATGFPFGGYHHTESMGPKLFHVPLVVGPIFAVAGYLGWVLAGILLGDAVSAPQPGVQLAKPVIAAFITTSWDFCVDPIGGTVNRDWVWIQGGSYFGVPWLNFFGWMLTTWVIFQLFALYLARREDPGTAVPVTSYWLQPVVFWGLLALQFPLMSVLVRDGEAVDPGGTAWQVADLFETMALVSVFTMTFVALLCVFVLHRSRARL